MVQHAERPNKVATCDPNRGIQNVTLNVMNEWTPVPRIANVDPGAQIDSDGFNSQTRQRGCEPTVATARVKNGLASDVFIIQSHVRQKPRLFIGLGVPSNMARFEFPQRAVACSRQTGRWMVWQHQRRRFDLSELGWSRDVRLVESRDAVADRIMPPAITCENAFDYLE